MKIPSSRQPPDKTFLLAAIILLIGGLLILASASMGIAQRNTGFVGYYLVRQTLLGGLLGAAAFLFAQWLPYRHWKKVALPLIILAISLLAMLFISGVSYSAGGARRWLSLGPLSFQPSEVMKFAFIVYLASWLDARRKEIPRVSYGLIPFSLMLAIIGMFLIMQPDIGTLGVIVITAAALYFLGGGKLTQIAMLCLFGAIIFFFLVQLAPYRLNRIEVFFRPGTDPQGIGYQTNQSFIGIGSGGFWGQGFGRSVQKLGRLPEPMGDSIFSVFAEEMGFLGAILLIGAFVFFFLRGMRIASRAPDTFGKLLGSGISVSIAVQAFVNMAAISGLMPLTGITLPFVSYGGTSLVMTLFSVGVLSNISKYG